VGGEDKDQKKNVRKVSAMNKNDREIVGETQ
jgi:hypothetical protein